MRHQSHLGGVHAASPVVIDDGGDLSRTGEVGLAYQAGHAGERNAIHGDDLVHGLHAGAARLGQRLHQKTGGVGVIQRRPRAVGVEEAVKGGCSAGHVEKRGTYS